MARVDLDAITQDRELLVQVRQLEVEHDLVVMEYAELLGPAAPAMALEWQDLGMPAIVVRISDYSSKEMCVRAMIKAWHASRELVDKLREAGIMSVQAQSKMATKQ